MYNYNENFKKFITGAKAFFEGLSKNTKKEKKEEKEQKPQIIKDFEDIDKNSEIDKMFKAAEYDSPTDEEIKAAAEKETALKHLNEKDKIIDSLSKAYSALEEKKDTAAQNSDNEKKKTSEVYQQKIVKAQKDAVKQGLSRSSVIEEEVKRLTGEKSAQISGAQMSLQKQLQKLDGEIAEVKKQKQKALDDFDIKYAAELDNKIKELQAQRSKKEQETVKYNNTLKEKEKKYFATDEGAAQLLKVQEKKLAAAKKYYDQLSKEQALTEFIGNEGMKRHLGGYYAYMLNYLNNR